MTEYLLSMKNGRSYIKADKNNSWPYLLQQTCFNAGGKAKMSFTHFSADYASLSGALVFATLIDMKKRTGNSGAELKRGVIIVLVSIFHYRGNLLMTP